MTESVSNRKYLFGPYNISKVEITYGFIYPVAGQLIHSQRSILLGII
jgi:hypothetical protein